MCGPSVFSGLPIGGKSVILSARIYSAASAHRRANGDLAEGARSVAN
jgi:hypothetical protein